MEYGSSDKSIDIMGAGDFIWGILVGWLGFGFGFGLVGLDFFMGKI